jgi:hypothetical protein
MVFTAVLETVFDHSQPTRPWSEVFARPSLPIRENWKYRMVVNLVWFARNYLNIVVTCVLAVSYWFPGFFFTILCTLYMHSETCKKRPTRRLLMQLVQLGSLGLNNYLYGWLSGFLFTVCVAAAILLHAVFTPYTDERVKRYMECTRLQDQDRERFAPRTPVMTYTGRADGLFPDPPLPSDEMADVSPDPASSNEVQGSLADDSFRSETGGHDKRRYEGRAKPLVAGLRRRRGSRGTDTLPSRPSLASSLPEYGVGLYSQSSTHLRDSPGGTSAEVET